MTSIDSATRKYSLGPVKSWVYDAAYNVGPKFGVKTIGGWRKTGSVPNSDHPRGLALDYMTSKKDQGDRIAAYLIANAQALSIKYVIWYDRIWFPGEGWSRYTGPSNHRNHVHASFKDKPGTGRFVDTAFGGPQSTISDASCAWRIRGPGVDVPDILPGVPNEVGAPDVCVISKEKLRQVIGGMLIVGGAVVVIVGFVLLAQYALGKSETGRAVINMIPTKSPGVGR